LVPNKFLEPPLGPKQYALFKKVKILKLVLKKYNTYVIHIITVSNYKINQIVVLFLNLFVPLPALAFVLYFVAIVVLI
jgi:hypothetical protein